MLIASYEASVLAQAMMIASGELTTLSQEAILSSGIAIAPPALTSPRPRHRSSERGAKSERTANERASRK
jgi:hypothetical protein